MVGYKLSKNDWVTPFFVIFRSVREKLLVTVSFDHPVSDSVIHIKLVYHLIFLILAGSLTPFRHLCDIKSHLPYCHLVICPS